MLQAYRRAKAGRAIAGGYSLIQPMGCSSVDKQRDLLPALSTRFAGKAGPG